MVADGKTDEVLFSVFTRLCLLLKANGTDILIYNFFANYSSTASDSPSLTRQCRQLKKKVLSVTIKSRSVSLLQRVAKRREGVE